MILIIAVILIVILLFDLRVRLLNITELLKEISEELKIRHKKDKE